jgi:peptide chain release factor 2
MDPGRLISGEGGRSPHGWYGRQYTRVFLPPVLDLTDFKRDLSELTDRLGHAQDCL